MFCPYCGTDNNDTSLYCYACGSKIPSRADRAEEKILREKLLAFVVGAGAAVLVFAFVLYLSAHWPQRIDSPAPTPQPDISTDIAEEDMITLYAMRDILAADVPDGAGNYTVGLDAEGRLFLVSFSLAGGADYRRQTGVDFCTVKLSAIRAFCGGDVHLMVQLSDAAAPDTTLLTVTDGAVVYDADSAD